jgi:zinc D-Ala-D-Ala carboxypeptidase
VENKNPETISKDALVLLIVLLIMLAGYVGWFFWSQNKILLNEITKLEKTLETTEASLKQAEGEKITLSDQLDSEQKKVGLISEKFDEVADVVSDLEKLSKTDPELLQKYSKVFFLNEHYVPQRLSAIDPENVYNEAVLHQIHTDVLPHLSNLAEDAASDGVTLWVVSAYRSFGTQSSLKSKYTVTYGSGANSFSADQGYSEHQLGTTVDFTTMGLGGGFAGFENTDAYQWLLNNAHQYGFTLSYPEGNAYYIFEPWHWRFVGTSLAGDLYRNGKNFYDLDQRSIDGYLIDVFD